MHNQSLTHLSVVLNGVGVALDGAGYCIRWDMVAYLMGYSDALVGKGSFIDHCLIVCLCCVAAIEESIASGGAGVSGDNVASHRNDLQRLRREVIGFRTIEKASGKTVITKSCGITDV